MGGIYGDILLAWPEQNQSITVYKLKPKHGGGWDHENHSNKTIIGIIQNTSGNRLKDANGNLAMSSGMELWTSEAGLNGYFTTYNSVVYRITGENAWNREGGFCRYTMEKLVGNNGTEPINITWNTGSNSFN